MGSSGLLQTLSDSGLTRALAFGSCICVGVEQPKYTNTPINTSLNVKNAFLSKHTPHKVSYMFSYYPLTSGTITKKQQQKSESLSLNFLAKHLEVFCS